MSKAPTILMTADAVGGVWRYCVDLLHGLAEHGAEVLLATFGPRPSAPQKLQIAAIPGVTLVESSCSLEWMREPWSDVDAAGEWLLSLQTEFQADVIHLNGFSLASLPWNAPVLVTAHSCVFSWWRAVHGCAPGPEWDEYRRRVVAGLHAADIITAPSTLMATALRDEYGIPVTGIEIVHNFSRVRGYEHGQKQDFCLAAGRLWDPAKNLQLLDEIAGRVAWPIRVAGSDRGPDNALITPRSLQQLGVLSEAEMSSQLQAARIFLHPALYEPFGLAVLEAAISLCCLVLADIPSLRELWADAAVFIDPRDSQGWAFEVNRLCVDANAREELASRAHSRAALFSATGSVDKYLELYEGLVQTKRARGVAA